MANANFNTLHSPLDFVLLLAVFGLIVVCDCVCMMVQLKRVAMFNVSDTV